MGNTCCKTERHEHDSFCIDTATGGEHTRENQNFQSTAHLQTINAVKTIPMHSAKRNVRINRLKEPKINTENNQTLTAMCPYNRTEVLPAKEELKVLQTIDSSYKNDIKSVKDFATSILRAGGTGEQPIARQGSKDKCGLLNNSTDLNNSGVFLRCQTNFKVEPIHFRLEISKEDLEKQYIIEDVIGRGSFGEVKRIKEKATGMYRAIKVIEKNNCQKTDDFADEIEIIKKLVFFNSKKT